MDLLPLGGLQTKKLEQMPHGNVLTNTELQGVAAIATNIHIGVDNLHKSFQDLRLKFDLAKAVELNLKLRTTISM